MLLLTNLFAEAYVNSKGINGHILSNFQPLDQLIYRNHGNKAQ